jgi:hypothetical protein
VIQQKLLEASRLPATPLRALPEEPRVALVLAGDDDF